jgi:hypothetical protein
MEVPIMRVDISKTKRGTELYVEQFDSLGELLRHAGANKAPKSSNNASNATWAGGTHSLAEAVELGLKGYSEVRPDVDSQLAELESHIAEHLEVAFRAQHSVVGGSVDVARFIQGEPECMIDYVAEPQARMGRVVKVLVNMVFSASVNTADIVKRGVVVCALIDTLHKLGVGVEVWSEEPTAHSGMDKGDVQSHLTKLHDSSEMLDIDNLMFGLCHPSMLRRIGFSVTEQSGWRHAKTIISCGYGFPNGLECAERIGADVVVGKVQDCKGDMLSNPCGWVLSTVSGLGLIEE